MIGASQVKITTSDSSYSYTNIILAIAAVILLFYLINHYYSKKTVEPIHNQEDFEPFVDKGFSDTDSISSLSASLDEPVPASLPKKKPTSIARNVLKKEDSLKDILDPNTYNKDISADNQFPVDCFPKDKLNPDELLPADPNSKWALVNPQGQGELSDQNFLEAGFHIGTNTVGQTLRNPNLQLRSEPPCPQVKVSPWMQSTMEADVNRRALEIGSC